MLPQHEWEKRNIDKSLIDEFSDERLDILVYYVDHPQVIQQCFLIISVKYDTFPEVAVARELTVSI